MKILLSKICQWCMSKYTVLNTYLSSLLFRFYFSVLGVLRKYLYIVHNFSRKPCPEKKQKQPAGLWSFWWACVVWECEYVCVCDCCKNIMLVFQFLFKCRLIRSSMSSNKLHSFDTSPAFSIPLNSCHKVQFFLGWPLNIVLLVALLFLWWKFEVCLDIFDTI